MRDRPSRQLPRIAFLAAAVACVALVAAGADRPGPAPIFSTQLEEVHLTVTVRDATGRLVSDLKPGDFTVLENGRPQRVQLFGRAVEPGQEEALALDLGLLMDTSASMLTQLKLSQEAAVRFLESIPRATSSPSSSTTTSPLPLQQREPAGLFERIADAKGGGDTAPTTPSPSTSRVQDPPAARSSSRSRTARTRAAPLGLGECLQLIRSSGVTIYPIAFMRVLAGSARALRSKSALEQMAELTAAVFTRARRSSPESTSASSWSCRRNTSSATSPTIPRATGSSAA
jgi:Ca-activated chloride channel family protein